MLQRTYYLRVPVGYQANRSYPLIFRWHGAGGNALDGAIPIEKASKEDAIVVSADGHDTSFGNGWDFDANGPDVTLFDTLLERVSNEYCVDRARVFSYGFSMGGGFSLILGCVRGEALRAIGAVEGWWLPPAMPPAACVGHVATWIVQGKADPVVTAEHAAHIRDTVFLPQNGCSGASHQAAPAPCQAFDGCMAGYPEVWCETNATHDPQTDFATAGAWAFWSSLPDASPP